MEAGCWRILRFGSGFRGPPPCDREPLRPPARFFRLPCEGVGRVVDDAYGPWPGARVPGKRDEYYARNTRPVKTISLKVTEEQAELIAQEAKRRGFPSKSEFIRYVLTQALEEEISLGTVEEIFLSRRQVREGKTVPLDDLLRGE